MADSSGMADIRGLQIDKLVKGFADEENVFKQFCNVSDTAAREIRWFQKTSGFLDTADTTAVTASGIANTASKARPMVTEQTWTRNTSYVKKYFVESPILSEEDIKDCDVDILATNIRDLVRAVERQVDQAIINVLTENYSPSTIQTTAATADGWDDSATGNPILDLLTAKQMIRAYGYNPEGAVLAINSIEHKNLLNFLISVKGSSIPSFASGKMESGVVMEILGLKVVVSENVTTDYAVVFVPQRAVTWKSFMPITSAVISDPGIGRKIRVWEEGAALLTDPKAVCLITDTVV
jgi:hypothetical protein